MRHPLSSAPRDRATSLVRPRVALACKCPRAHEARGASGDPHRGRCGAVSAPPPAMRAQVGPKDRTQRASRPRAPRSRPPQPPASFRGPARHRSGPAVATLSADRIALPQQSLAVARCPSPFITPFPRVRCRRLERARSFHRVSFPAPRGAVPSYSTAPAGARGAGSRRRPAPRALRRGCRAATGDARPGRSEGPDAARQPAAGTSQPAPTTSPLIPPAPERVRGAAPGRRRRRLRSPAALARRRGRSSPPLRRTPPRTALRHGM